MTTTTSLSQSSRFLVGVATATIVLVALITYLYFSFSPNGGSTWIIISIGELSQLACLLLCAWVGQILRTALPNPAKELRIALFILAILGILWYGLWWELIEEPVNSFFYLMMLGCGILSYLMPLDCVKEHNKIELMVMTIVMALLYAACYGVESHRWAQIPAALCFLYYIILLSHEQSVERFVDGRWVKPVLIVLSALAFAAVLYRMISNFHWSFGNDLSNFCKLLVQPLVVYPFICFTKNINRR